MFFSRKAASPRTDAARVATVPPGQRIYAVGDVHGRRELLDQLADMIAAEIGAFPCADARTVFLGDYVDRGLQSFAVVDRLAKGDFPTPIVTLRGNHEATLLEFLDDEQALEQWRHYGGIETLVSYGVDVKNAQRGRNFAETRVALMEKMPSAHLDFYRATPLWWSCGDYFFCHAGIRPRVPLARQQERDLLWIRYDFLDDPTMHEKVVVHGHTPVNAPESLPNRINVDTGAYATDVLTCVVLEGDQRRFMSTGAIR